MARLLQGVATPEGTAPEAAIPNYEVAGKTGTTQKLVPVLLPNGTTRLGYSKLHHVASFVGFFPASRPQVAISVIVDDADAHAPGGVAYGAKIAAPSFKHLGEQLIQYLDIKPVYDTSNRTALAMEGGRR
jgi:cell division protein FtsI/penicillin-binding protein 2